MEGTVKWFNPHKAYGFIAGDDGEDYFVHLKALGRGVMVREKDRVSFEAVETDRGKQAQNVTLAAEGSTAPGESAAEGPAVEAPEGEAEEKPEAEAEEPEAKGEEKPEAKAEEPKAKGKKAKGKKKSEAKAEEPAAEEPAPEDSEDF